MIYKIIRKNLKVQVFVLIMGMITGNISFAVQIDAEQVKPAGMLAPAVQIEDRVFVLSYKQIAQKADLSVGEISGTNVVEAIFRGFSDLGQNKDSGRIRANTLEALRLMQYASELKIGLEALSSIGPQNVDMKQVMSIRRDGDQAARKAIALCETVLNDMETAGFENLADEKSKNQLKYLVLTLKAKARYFWIDANKMSTDAKVLKIIKDELIAAEKDMDQALLLPEANPGFKEYKLLCDICAFKIASPGLTLKDIESNYPKLKEYYALAQGEIAGISDQTVIKDDVEEMNYNHFIVLTFIAGFFKRRQDVTQAFGYYNKAAELVDKVSEKDYSDVITQFYGNYSMFSEAYAKKIAKELENGDKGDSKEKLIPLFEKAAQIAKKYLNRLNDADKNKDKHILPLLNIIEFRTRLAEMLIDENDLPGALKQLKSTVIAVKQINEYKRHHSYYNFFIAQETMRFIGGYIGLFTAYIKNGFIADERFSINDMLDADYFADFIKNYNNGVYEEVLKNLSADINNNTAKQVLCKYFFVDSEANAHIRQQYQLSLTARKKLVPAKRSKFNKLYSYAASITLALTHIYDEDYALAEKQIRAAAQYTGFENSAVLWETIFPHLVLNPQEGKVLIYKLLSGLSGAKFKAYITRHKDKLTAEFLGLLSEVFNDEKTKSLRKGNEHFIETLGLAVEIPVKAVKKKKKKKKKILPLRVKGAVKTSEVLLAQVERKLEILEGKLSYKPKRAKKKGKKKAKRPKALNMNSMEIKQLRNALGELVERYEHFASEQVLEYLRNIPKNKTVFQNIYIFRAVTQTIASMEKEEALDILQEFIKEAPADPAMAKELEQLYDKGAVYFKRLQGFELHCRSLEQRLKKINVDDLYLAQAQMSILEIEAGYKKLAQEYEDIGIRKSGASLLKNYRDSFAQMLGLLQEKIDESYERKVRMFIDSLQAETEKLQERFQKAVSDEMPQIERFYALKDLLDSLLKRKDQVTQPSQGNEFTQWLKSEGLLLPKGDNLDAREKITQAITDYILNLENLSVRIKAKIQENSFICKGMVKFKVLDEGKKLLFKGQDIPTHALNNAFPVEGRAVIRAFVARNPKADVFEDITAEEADHVENWLVPLVEKEKQEAFALREILRFARETDKTCEKYEKALQEIIDRRLPLLQTIKAIDNLLADDLKYPKVDESVQEDHDGIWEKAIADFEERRFSLLKKQRMFKTVCRGNFRIELRGDYSGILFVPLVADPIINGSIEELENIWAEILSYNINADMRIPQGTSLDEEWVQDIANIWLNKLDMLRERKEKEQLIEGDVSVEAKAEPGAVMLINSSI